MHAQLSLIIKLRGQGDGRQMLPARASVGVRPRQGRREHPERPVRYQLRRRDRAAGHACVRRTRGQTEPSTTADDRLGPFWSFSQGYSPSVRRLGAVAFRCWKQPEPRFRCESSRWWSFRRCHARHWPATVGSASHPSEGYCDDESPELQARWPASGPW